MRDQAVGRGAPRQAYRGELGRKPGRRKVTSDAGGVLSGRDPEADSKIESQDHAKPNRLSVQQGVAEPGLGFQRMAEGMAEIEQSAVTLLTFVGGDGGCWSRTAVHPPAASPEKASARISATDAAASAVCLLAADTALPGSAARPYALDPR